MREKYELHYNAFKTVDDELALWKSRDSFVVPIGPTD